jgi:signal transduction histidine kinase
MQATQSSTASEFIGPIEFAGFGGIEDGIAEGAGLAHDAKNLLGALGLYSELLAMPGVLHEEHREFAAELRLLSDRSWAMIARLVDYAQVKKTLAPVEKTILPEVVERCRGVLSRVAGRKVEVSFDDGAYEWVQVQEEAVERILTNLVKNASESMVGEEGIGISVNGMADGARRWVVMTVRDTGCGLSRTAVRRLMQAGGISPVGGRGLGFRVVKELVASSGGCLSLESQPGVGTSISVKWECGHGIERSAG